MEEEIRDEVPQEAEKPETERAAVPSEDVPEAEAHGKDVGGVLQDAAPEEESSPRAAESECGRCRSQEPAFEGESAPTPLHNPLPEPVPGRRDEMEFPITDIDDEEDPLADPADTRTANHPEGIAESCPESDSAPAAGTAAALKTAGEEPEDDFDFQIDDSDDFDI